jgi:hypothetical protein
MTSLAALIFSRLKLAAVHGGDGGNNSGSPQGLSAFPI